jgi:hypothetical protein
MIADRKTKQIFLKILCVTIYFLSQRSELRQKRQENLRLDGVNDSSETSISLLYIMTDLLQAIFWIFI